MTQQDHCPICDGYYELTGLTIPQCKSMCESLLNSAKFKVGQRFRTIGNYLVTITKVRIQLIRGHKVIQYYLEFGNVKSKWTSEAYLEILLSPKSGSLRLTKES